MVSGRPLRAEEFIRRAEEIHTARFDYSQVAYRTLADFVTITCKAHGETFTQKAQKHLDGRVSCTQCTGLSLTECVRRSKIMFPGQLSYAEVSYESSTGVIANLICVKHKYKFNQLATNHFKGKQGCKECQFGLNTETFIKNYAKENIDYGEFEYVSMRHRATFRCVTHNQVFVQLTYKHKDGHIGCSRCQGKKDSMPERELAEYVVSLGYDIIRNDRSVLGRREIDILIPDIWIGLEFDGTYWHSDEFIRRRYGVSSREWHAQKDKQAKSKGIVLLHVTESQWKANRKETEEWIRTELEEYTG